MAKSDYNLGFLGLGDVTTAFYIDTLNALYSKQRGVGGALPLLKLYTDFDRINAHLPNDFTFLEKELRVFLKELSALGANQIILPNITLHETYDRIKGESDSVPVIHPVEKTAENLENKGVKEVVVFGSQYTMTSDYLPNYFGKYEVQIRQPKEEDQLFIDSVRKKTFAGDISADEIILFNHLIQSYATSVPVVLACTELSIVWDHKNSAIDMARIQVRAAIEYISGSSAFTPASSSTFHA